MDKRPMDDRNYAQVAKEIARNYIRLYGRNNLMIWFLNNMSEADLVQLYVGNNPFDRTLKLVLIRN